MEKLIKLLNEYKIYTDHKESRMSEYVWANVWDDIVMSSYVWTTKDKKLEIISKKFRFIQRLVKHDKIDFDNRELKDKFMEEFERYPTFHNNTYNQDFNINWLLMLLSIQDDPIEFLVSILK